MSQLKHSEMSVVPWWKHRWPWILMSGPFVAAVGCAITIWLTFSAVDQPIREGVVKQGLKVVPVPSPNDSATPRPPAAGASK